MTSAHGVGRPAQEQPLLERIALLLLFVRRRGHQCDLGSSDRASAVAIALIA